MNNESPQTVISPVDALVRAGFVREFQRQFRARTIFVSSPDMVHNLKTMFGNEEVKYPYCFLLPQTVGPNGDSYTTNRIARHGVPVTINVDGKQFQSAKVLPANFDVEVTFVVSKYEGTGLDTVDGFVRRWLMCRRTGALNFTVDYGLTKFTVSTTLTDSIAIPKRESPGDQEPVYALQPTLTIHGFVSEPVLQTRGRINQVVLGDGPPPGKGSQFFPF